MQLSKEELKKIREHLPKGSDKKLAEQFNFKNAGSIRNILSGRSNNSAVIQAAAALAAENKSSEDAIVSEVKKTVKAL